MGTAVDLFWLILRTGMYIFLNPLFWGVLVLIYFQTRSTVRREEEVYNLQPRGRKAVLKRLLNSGLYGVIGGFLGSIIFVVVGVTLSDIGIGYLWLVAILGLLINVRFLCFSYAGGIVGLSSIILGWPEVNVAAILMIVAVLHLIESILIQLSGGEKPLPLTVAHPEEGRVGLFLLQKLWPIPFVALIALAVMESEVPGAVIDMPDWWPLIDTLIEIGSGETVMYILLPVAAGLGYGDMAVTSRPREKARHTARRLFGYSIVLLLLALSGSYFPPVLLVGALFSFLGHEKVIRTGRKVEQKGSPLYTPPREGLLILGVLEDYPADEAGLKRGDILLAADGMVFQSPALFYEYCRDQSRIVLEVRNRENFAESEAQGNQGVREVIFDSSTGDLGLVFLSDRPEQRMSDLTERSGYLPRLLSRLKNRFFSS